MEASQGGQGQPSSVTYSVIIQISIQSSNLPASQIPSQPTDAPQPNLELIRRQAMLDITMEVDADAATSTHEELAIAPDPTPSQSAKFNTVFENSAPTPSKSLSQFPSVAATDSPNSSSTTVIQTGQGPSLPIGAIIGITVAAGVALFAVMIAGCAIWQRDRRRKKARGEVMRRMDGMYDFVPGQAPPVRPEQGPMIEMGRRPLTKDEKARYPYPTHTPTLSQASLAARELPPLPVERGAGDKWGHLVQLME